MASTRVLVSEHTRALLQELATATGQPSRQVLEQAVERYRGEQFFAELDAACERLRADPVAWQEELAERALLEGTLADGLDDLRGPPVDQIRVNERTAMRGPRRSG